MIWGNRKKSNPPAPPKRCATGCGHKLLLPEEKERGTCYFCHVQTEKYGQVDKAN